MEQTLRGGFLGVLSGRGRVGHFGSAVVGACFSLCLFLTPVLLCAQAQGPLTLDQVRNLINIGAPDATVAHEIQTRGLAFTPDRELLARFESQHAGTKTLAALRDLLPMLDEAKKQVPQVLQAIYSALDQGNPLSVHNLMSNELANNTAKLDTICKPFTYRSHYVEGVIERPQKRFEVRVHVLFKPLDERVYLLWFGLSGTGFQLQDVGDPPADWFQPQLTGTEQVVRKFVYAVNAGRNDVVQQIVTPGLVANLGYSKALSAIRSSQISQVSTRQLGLLYYKGVKIRNEIWIHENGKFCCATYVFLAEPGVGDPKIVAWSGGNGGNGYESEDAALEYSTLKRFGISAQPPTEPQVAKAPPSSAQPQDHYINEGNAAEYLDLAPEGKFIWRVGGRDFAGTYELSSGIVTLRFPPVGATAHGKLENGRFNCCSSNGLDPTASALIDNESRNWVRQGESQPAPSTQQSDALRFNVRHRHKPGFITTPEAAGITFCSGVLTIDKKTVQYYCTQPDVAKNRCERVTITEIKEVKYQENGLRIATHGGSWDFFLDDQGQLVRAHDAVVGTLK